MNEPFLNSSLATAILHEISKEEEGTYSKAIAEELEKPLNSVNRLVKSMEREGILSKGERGISQPYILNPDGLVDFWIREIKEHFEEDGASWQRAQDAYQDFQEDEDEIRRILREYLTITLQHYNPHSESTLQQCIFQSTANDIQEFERKGPSVNQPEFFDYLPTVINDYVGAPTYYPVMANVLQDGELFDNVIYPDEYEDGKE
jgi:DNA-binding IscR family transcriptional regulator